MTKQKYYNITQLLRTNAQYLMPIGERSNGKSYSTKEVALWEAYNEKDFLTHEPITRYEIGYLRRWRDEIKNRDVALYFDDMNIYKITNGEYTSVTCKQSDIFFCNIVDGKTIIGKKIGSAFALTGSTHYKSLAFPRIRNIIFEEFITNTGYLPNEVSTLIDIVSTIARRDYVRVFMIGNTISRLCPYFDEWQLTNVKRQKQGSIDIYNQSTSQYDEDNNPIVVKIAVEYCANESSNTKMFFGKNAKMVTSGVWETKEYPHLPKPIREYRNIYNVLYEYKSFRFRIELLVDKKVNEFILFVHPHSNNDNIKRVVTDKFSSKQLTTTYLTEKTIYDNLIIGLLNENKIVYSDNLTGTEFNQIKKERGRW